MPPHHRLTASIRLHRSGLRAFLLWAGWLLAAATLAAAVLRHRYGVFLLLYIAPMPPTGAYWARLRLATLDRRADAEVLLDLWTFVAAACRVLGGWIPIPYSGHMVFLTYSLLRTPHRGYRVLALALWGMTTWYKFYYLPDVSGWIIGLALGLVLATVGWRLQRRTAVA